MLDTLVPIKLQPGLFKNGTKYQAHSRWYDANLVRFFDDTIRPIGGWARLQSSLSADLAPLTGTPRAAVAWRTDANGVVQVFATTSNVYAVIAGSMIDITPAGYVVGRTDTGNVSGDGKYNSLAYSTGPYGTISTAVQLTNADTWQLAPFGNTLAMVSTSDNKLYTWVPNTSAVLPTVAAGSPLCVGVVVTPERFLMTLGAGGDARQVWWATQETSTDWTSTALNSAGNFRLATLGSIMCGRATRGQTLIWTDSDLHTVTYIGGLLVFRFARVGENCGIIAPQAVAMVDGQALWMGHNGFFRFDGYVRQIPSDVQDYVFGDLNYFQRQKIWATSISEYGEVWWFYPSASSAECDRYVLYNYVEDHWCVGKLKRTTGYDVGAVPNPVMITDQGLVYEHEQLDGKVTVVVRLADGTSVADNEWLANGEISRTTEQPYLESGPFELGTGDNVMRIQRILPDAATLADVQVRLYGSFDPVTTETVYPAASPAAGYTLAEPTSVQITARQIRLRVEEVNQRGWRLGTVRLGVRQSSRR